MKTKSNISIGDLALIKATQYKKRAKSKLSSVDGLLAIDEALIRNTMRTVNTILPNLNKHNSLSVESRDQLYNLVKMVEYHPIENKPIVHRFDIAMYDKFTELVYIEYRKLIKSDQPKNIDAVREYFVTSLDYEASYTKLDLIKRLKQAYKKLKIDELSREIDLKEFFTLKRYERTEYFYITSVVGATETIKEPEPKKPRRFIFA